VIGIVLNTLDFAFSCRLKQQRYIKGTGTSVFNEVCGFFRKLIETAVKKSCFPNFRALLPNATKYKRKSNRNRN